MRKLATIREISELAPIEGADKIEMATVDGWCAVVKKGAFLKGDKIVFIEPDAMIPIKDWSKFLERERRPGQPARLKTMKLRGVISQGLVVHIAECLPEGEYSVDDDVTELLEIKLYEPPEPNTRDPYEPGRSIHDFPSHLVPKTDSERAQNLWNKEKFQAVLKESSPLVATCKCDGSSLTAMLYEGEYTVCSRNRQFMDPDTGANRFCAAAYRYRLGHLLRYVNRNLAIQAELVGPGIQSNRMKLKSVKIDPTTIKFKAPDPENPEVMIDQEKEIEREAAEIRVFDVYDIDAQRYFNYGELEMFCRNYDLPMVRLEAIFSYNAADDNWVVTKFDDDSREGETTPKEIVVNNIDDLFKLVEGVKYPDTDQQIEGWVIKSAMERHATGTPGNRVQFKVVSKSYACAADSEG